MTTVRIVNACINEQRVPDWQYFPDEDRQCDFGIWILFFGIVAVAAPGRGAGVLVLTLVLAIDWEAMRGKTWGRLSSAFCLPVWLAEHLRTCVVLERNTLEKVSDFYI